MLQNFLPDGVNVAEKITSSKAGLRFTNVLLSNILSYPVDFFGLSLIVWCILQQLNTSTKTITGVLLMLTHRPLKHKPYY